MLVCVDVWILKVLTSVAIVADAIAATIRGAVSFQYFYVIVLFRLNLISIKAAAKRHSHLRTRVIEISMHACKHCNAKWIEIKVNFYEHIQICFA